MSERVENGDARRLPSWARLMMTAAAILVLPSCLGLAGGVALFGASRAGLLSRWRSLGTPPKGATEIVAADIETIYVRAATGELYGCRDHRGRRVPDNCWHQASEPLGIDPDTLFGERLSKRDPTPPRGSVVDSLDTMLRYADAAFETRYVLLQDGAVWKWQYDTSAYGDLGILVLGPVAGLALGIIAGIVLGVRAAARGLRRRADSRSSDQGA